MNIPPKTIPEELLEGYNMGGLAEIRYSYRNDTQGDNINMDIYTMDKFTEYLEKIKKKEWSYYGPTDGWLYKLLKAYPIKNQHVLLIGSTTPWYETVLIHYGARMVTVLEYREQETFHPQIQYLTPDEIGDKQFDACLSISSVEHDGLGRYGDPLNPDGDLEHMQNLKKLVVPHGLLYLAIPVGKEQVIFNLHRIYGRKRYHKLIKGWTHVADIGFETNNGFSNTVNGVNGTPFQPLFVLSNDDTELHSTLI